MLVSRQVLGEPFRGKRLLILPAILAVVGVIDLTEHGHHPGSSDIVLIVLGLLVAAAIGVKQGLSMHLERRDGFLWGQLPARALWLWAALIVTHGALRWLSGSALMSRPDQPRSWWLSERTGSPKRWSWHLGRWPRAYRLLLRGTGPHYFPACSERRQFVTLEHHPNRLGLHPSPEGWIETPRMQHWAGYRRGTARQRS